MKMFIGLAPFLAFLITAQSQRASSSYSGSRGQTDRGSSTNLLDKDKDKGYKIVIKLDDAFGKAGEDLELLQEMNADIKLIKLLLEEVIPDIQELRKTLPESIENTNAQELRQMRAYATANASRLSNSYSNSTTSIWDSIPKSDCAEIRLRGQIKSGIYAIQPDRSKRPIAVYCDMDNEMGGWTTIQRRGVYDIPKRLRDHFYRTWNEYETGFGNVESDYWLGLEHIHALTKDCNNELLINITAWDGTSKYAKYTKFNITGKDDFYRLNIAGYSGTAGDAMLHHNTMRFTTHDKQNDVNGDDNCARLYKGAWWYKDCFWSNLNGDYAEDGLNGKMSTRQGIEWGQRHYYSFMKTEMKIKPKC